MGSILVVSDNINGFLVNTVSTELEMKKFLVSKATLEDENLSERILEATVILAVLSDEFEAKSIFATSFKNKCEEAAKKIVVYGNQDKVLDIKETFGEDLILDEFVRPIENEKVSEKIGIIIDRIENPNKQKHILVVDDSGPMLRTIMKWFEGKYKVSLANNATVAFAQINKEKPDLILLDYEMPVCSGPQFLMMLREDDNTKNIPVIFLTALNDVEMVKSVLALKPQGYILKSTTKELVVAKVDKFFNP